MLKLIGRSATIAILTVGLAVGGALAQASGPGDILGVWETEDGGLKLEMFDNGGTFAARVVYGNRLVEADGSFKLDVNNPDPNLRSRSTEGVLFLSDLKWDGGDGRWEDGMLYDPSSGQSYAAQVSLQGPVMEVRGYVGTPMLGRSVMMHRSQ